MKERDMYYNSYGYEGTMPLNNFQNQYPVFFNNSAYDFPNIPNGMSGNYLNGQFNDINERVSRLERQIKRIDQRLTRLETPYANSTNFPSDGDNNMYMM